MWAGFHDLSSLQPLGWMIVHSVWELAAIWIAHRTVQHLLREFASSVRYVAAVTMLALCPAAALLTLKIAASGSWLFDVHQLTQRFPNGHFDLPKLPRLYWWTPAMVVVARMTPFACIAWLIGVAYQLWQSLSARREVAELRRLSAGIEPPSCWQHLCERLTPGLHVALRASDQVRGAVTGGWLRPIVFVPIGMLSGMSPSEVESILAHELAHIRRRDALVYSVQDLIQSVFFYHPGVLSIIRSVDTLREECCDDLAVSAIGGDHKRFAQALLAADEFTMRATLAARGGELVTRVRRMKEQQKRTPARTLTRCAAALVIAASMLSFTFNAAAMSVQTQATLSITRSITMGDAVYKLLSIPKIDNLSVAPAVNAAVTAMKADKLDNDLLRRCAAVLNAGSQPSALLGHTFFKRKDWQRLAARMMDLAASEPQPLRRSLTQAALVLSAQDSISPGAGYLYNLATDPRLLDLLGLDDQTTANLRIIVETAGSRDIEGGELFLAWKKQSPGTPPPDKLLTLAASSPFLQAVLDGRLTIGKGL